MMIARRSFLAAVLLGFCSLISKGSFLEEKRINIEMMIVDQLDRELRGVLAKNRYSLLVDVDLSMVQKKKLLMGEVESRSSKGAQEEGPQQLPGFEFYEKEKLADKQGDEIEKREQYMYEDSYTIDNVFVQLVLDTNISQNKKDIIKDIITDKISKKYGYRSRVKVREVDFIDSDEAGNFASRVSAFFVRNIEFILLLTLLLLIIFVMTYYLFFRRRKPEEKESDSNVVASDEGARPAFAAAGVATVDYKKSLRDNIKNIVEHVKKSPLIARSCLKSLSSEHRLAIVDAVEARSLQSYFKNLLSFSEEESKSLGRLTEASLVEKSKEVLNALGKAEDVQGLLLKQRFAYLDLLTVKEILTLISDFSSKEVAIVLRYLNANVYPQVLKSLAQEMKVGIVKYLSAEEDYGIEAEKEIDEKLRTRILDLYNKIMIKDVDKHQVIEDFLENDPQIEETMKELRTDPSFDFADKYKLLLLTYEEAIEDFDRAKEVMQDLDNSDVTALLAHASEEQRNKYLEEFLELRKNIITNLIAAEKPGEEEVTTAKRRFMLLYRQRLKEADNE